MPKVLFVDQKETSATYWIADLTKQEVIQLKSDEKNTIDFILEQLNEYGRKSYYHLAYSCRYGDRQKSFRIAAVIERNASKVKCYFKSYFYSSSSYKGNFSFDPDGQKNLLDSKEDTLLNLAANSELSYDNQTVLFDYCCKVQYGHHNIFYSLLENPTLHKDFQLKALSFKVHTYDLVLARNNKLDFEVQEKLFDDKDYYLLSLLYSNKNLSLDLQRRMLSNKSYKVRRCLAQNKNLHKEIFLALAKD